MVIPTLPSLLLLLLSPKLSFATDEFMTGWKRTPKSIRCRPSVRVEAGTCRKRTFGGATQAVLDASLVAGLSITIPIPQLETEALFYTPFSFAVQVYNTEQKGSERVTESFSGCVQLHWPADGCAGEEHPRAVDYLHQA